MPPLGGPRGGGRPGHRTAGRASPAGCGSSTASDGDGARPTCRPRPSATTPRSTTGRWPARPTSRPGAADDPGRTAGADRLRRRPPGDAVATRRWVYRQYDHQLFLNTVVGPGGDAAVLRLAGPGLPPSGRGLALTTDSNPRWCADRPPGRHRADRGRVASLNVACAGARPVAVVNCLNFGNPEHPEVMWQLSEAIDGMAEACRALGLPVVGGNVSLYNESAGPDIDPTPVVGVLGLIDASGRTVRRGSAWSRAAPLVLLGPASDRRRTAGPPSLAGSRWAVELPGPSQWHACRSST